MPRTPPGRSRGAGYLAPRGPLAKLRGRGLGAAQPIPLQAHAGPDALGDAGCERRRAALEDGIAQRTTDAQPYLAGADAPAPAYGIAADHRDRGHGRAGFQSEAPDAAARIAQRTGTNTCALREHHHAITARKDLACGRHRVAIARAAVHGKGTKRVQHPRLPALFEQLT